MLFRSIRFAAVIVAVLLCVPAAGASAQAIPFNDLKGKIVAISGNIIQWTDATKAEMYVQLDKKTKTQVTGEFEPSFLAPGLFVRFPAEVTRRGKVVGEISEMTIFSPADGFSTGVIEDGVPNPNATSSKYFISGQIDSSRNGQIVVQAGESSFKFKLAEEAKLKIEVSDYSIARPDDEITINGSGERKDQIVARGIEIKLASPLAGVEKKSRKGAAKKPAASKPASKSALPKINDVDVPELQEELR